MRSSVPTHPSSRTASSTQLPWNLVDLGILAVIFLAPLFMGGRGPVGKFVLVGLICVTAVAWVISQCRRADGHWQRSGVEWLLVAGMGLVALQLIPLPASLLAHLSPSLSELLPLWSADASTTRLLGEWSTISLTPSATRGALIVLVGYIMLFLLVVQRIKSIDDVERILRWVAIGAIAMAVLGMTQFLLGNGKFLWVYDHPSRDTFRSVKGAFHNQNHFAHFMALGVGPLIWTWTQAPSRSMQKQLYGIGMGLVFVAGLLTFSRGGVLVIAAASLATLAIFFWKSVLDKRALVMAGVMSALVAVALLIHGYQPLGNRLATLQQSRSISEASAGRADLWSALLDGIPQFAWLGAGIGSHRDVYPLFMEEYYNIEFTHGENGYLPLTLEGGIPALLLMLTGIGICFWWSYRVLQSYVPAASTPSVQSRQSKRREPATERPTTQRHAACAGAIVAALLASVIHSLGDFVWYISACMSITVLLAACLCRLQQLLPAAGSTDSGSDSAPVLDSRYRVRLPQPAWMGMAVILVIGSTMMLVDRHPSALAAPHWYAYKKLALPAYDTSLPEEAVERELLTQLSRHLEQCLTRDPHNPRANLRYASACLRRFDLEQRHATNPMALQQIREAALASQFASKDAQDAWLDVAIGENRNLLDLALKHCHRALAVSPLQGDGYVYLADLSFLEGPNAAAKNAYIDQAFRVRPHSGVVAFAMGQEYALTGDWENALTHWRGAFQQDPRIRSLIIEQFSATLPGDFFLEHFQPDLAALRELLRNYQRHAMAADAHLVATHFVARLVEQAQSADSEAAAAHWFEAEGVYAQLQKMPAALQCARRAVELDAGNLDYRRGLADLLLQNREYAEAVQQLQWCLRRKPEDPQLREKLAAANRGTIEQRSAAAPQTTPVRTQR